MKKIRINHPTKKVIGRISIPGSKSESNRLLILKALYFPKLQVSGLSDSRDTQYIQKALTERSSTVDVGDAGTAMRFLTAYLALSGREYILTGSSRMKERPIGILVDALNRLGANITYLEKEGYPPLQIRQGNLSGGEINLDSTVSSQFISALMMIGPALQGGLSLKMTGFSVSAPYIYLTANLMRRLGFKVKVLGEQIRVEDFIPKPPAQFQVEPDWSSASYWFLISLLAQKAEIYLPGFRQYSLQGDAFVSGLFEPLGVHSHYIGSGFRLKKGEARQNENYRLSLVHNPDLAQTLSVAFAALRLPATIHGLQTLRIKETDRLEALQRELYKAGAKLQIGKDYLKIQKGFDEWEEVHFESWNDHRMAMSLAPLALLRPIFISDPDVVNKSYTSFWDDLKKVGFVIEEI